jgi:hypothetical protein
MHKLFTYGKLQKKPLGNNISKRVMMNRIEKSIKITVILVALIAQTLCGFCQKKGMSFSEAANNGFTLQHLDSIYLSGLHVDSLKAAFSSNLYDTVHKSYTYTLKQLSRYLSSKGFKWGKKTQCFNKLYFSSTGEIDYFLFNFTPGQIEKGKETEFESLLNEFIKTYKFPLSAKKSFSLCSSVMYDD